MIRFEWRDDLAVFDELETWWNGRAGPTRTPFLRTEWFHLWAECRLAARERLRVLVGYEGESPVAAVPLLKRGARLVALSDTDSDSFDMICEDDSQVRTAVASELANRTYVRMDRLDASSHLMENVSKTVGWRVRRVLDSPYIVTSNGIEAVLAGMGKKLRNNVRRGERSLEGLGALTMEPSTPKELLGTVLEESLALEGRGWKGRIGRAVIDSPHKARFYRRLADLALAKDWLRLGVLRLDGRIVAFNFDLEYAGRMFGIVTSYDEELDSKCSPGHVLLLKTLANCDERGIETYEMGGGSENSWKLNWTRSTRPRCDIIGFGRNLNGRLLRTGSRIRSRSW